MNNQELTFNDLPQVVAQLRDEVMGMKALLARQQDESKRHLDSEKRHKPMTVDEAAAYTRIPLGTLYMKLADARSPPPSLASDGCSIRTNSTSGWRPTAVMQCL